MKWEIIFQNFQVKNAVLLKEVESLDFTGVKIVHIYWMASDCKVNKYKLNPKFWGKTIC